MKLSRGAGGLGAGDSVRTAEDSTRDCDGDCNMAARATWKGFLKISLVNIPIKVFPATESSGSISFNQLHGECQTRIQQKRWCPHCEREVPNSEIVKGYEFEKGRYVVMSRGRLRQGPSRRRRGSSIWCSSPTSRAIDPMYVDRAYYLAPDGAMAADAFAVMRDGMKGKVGIGKLALYGREYLVAVRPARARHRDAHAASRGGDPQHRGGRGPATRCPRRSSRKRSSWRGR